MLRWSQSAVRVLLGRSGALPGRFWGDPWWPPENPKNVVQTAPNRRACPALRPALYRGRFLMPPMGPPEGLAGAPKDFQKNVV